jgi:asparagine synthase (glutamine-hydrolysing)
MCGIAGIFGKCDEKLLQQILQTQKRRGPDGQDIWISPNKRAMLGHVRLAIMDPEGGKQPLSNEDHTLWAIVNGEIYNYHSLRAQLETRHTFQTQSDSEIVLHLFEEKGPAMIYDLDGMFSLALWGPHGIFLARDPIGVKPLYYGHDECGNLLFASEIKSLMNHINEIHEFPNGSYMLNHETPKFYYQFPQPSEILSDQTTVIQKIKDTLETSVIKRLMADVPLGVFLSGGLDSSLISAIAKQNISGELHSFAVGLENSADIINAREVAAYLGTIHHERILTENEIINALPTVIYALESCDPALVRSGIPNLFVSELAAEYVKVVLSGEGADELFAGYHYLKQYSESPAQMTKELLRITTNLHNSNLQRADRLSMHYGLEARVPFLDLAMIDLAFQINNTLKYNQIEKWILRKVAELYLPKDIVWRKKEKFSIGTGIGPVLQKYAKTYISNSELKNAIGLNNERFQSKEELLYWNIFKNYYGRIDIIAQMGKSRSLNPGEVWQSAFLAQ